MTAIERAVERMRTAMGKANREEQTQVDVIRSARCGGEVHAYEAAIRFLMEEQGDAAQAQWIQLSDLRHGAIFETKDGVRAVKSEYRYPHGGCECTLLASGEAAHFAQGSSDEARDHNATLVRELSVSP